MSWGTRLVEAEVWKQPSVDLVCYKLIIIHLHTNLRIECWYWAGHQWYHWKSHTKNHPIAQSFMQDFGKMEGMITYSEEQWKTINSPGRSLGMSECSDWPLGHCTDTDNNEMKLTWRHNSMEDLWKPASGFLYIALALLGRVTSVLLESCSGTALPGWT